MTQPGMPSPDSAAFALVVDRWLVDLRQSGASPRTLERRAATLADALNARQDGRPLTARQHVVLHAFLDFAREPEP